MNKLTRIVTPLIAVAILASCTLETLAQNQNDNKAADYASAPAGNPEQEQAYRDGVEAAKLDALAKRKVDATASHLYVHPPVKKGARDAYRETFKNGYEAAVKKAATS